MSAISAIRKKRSVNEYAEPNTAGVAFWYLLRAPAMREGAAAQLLEMFGESPWVPLRVATRRVGRFSMRIRHVPVSQAAFEGYLFAGVRRGEPDWLALFRSGLIRAVVCSGGLPYRFDTGDVVKLWRRQQDGEFNEDGRPRRAPAKLSAGDRLRVVDDEHLLWGREYVAERVQDGRVRVPHEWFGKTELVEIPLDVVAKLD